MRAVRRKDMFSSLLYMILAVLILNVIVVFHEFGHYVVGRLTGITVLEFSVGFGPRWLGWTRKGIDYSIRPIPLGGFCKFKGENEEDDSPDSFSNAPVWKRFLTVLSGPLMNFVLAFLAMIALLALNGWYESVPVVGQVIEGTPAAEAGLLAGDIVTAVDGEVLTYDEAGMLKMQQYIAGIEAGDDVAFTIDRSGEILSLSIAPAWNEEVQKAQIGIYFGTEHHRYAPQQLIPVSIEYMGEMSTMMLDALRNLFFRGEGLDETMGPVGIITTVGSSVQQSFQQATTQGFAMIFNMLVIISLNLGIMNLLPVPPLDGGHLVLMAVEAVRGKPASEKIRMTVQMIGVLLLIALFVFVTWQDIVRVIFG